MKVDEVLTQQRLAKELLTPHHLLPLSAEIGDDITHGVFAAGNIVTILSLVREAMTPVKFIIFFGSAWNVIDSIAAWIVGANTLNEAKRAKTAQRKRVMKTFAGMDIGSGAVLFGTNIGTTLAQLGLIHGLAATLFTPAAPIAFAACMYVAAIKSGWEFYRAKRKVNPLYLLEDRIDKFLYAKEHVQSLETQIQGIREQIQKLKRQQSSNRTEAMKAKSIDKKIESLEKERKELLELHNYFLNSQKPLKKQIDALTNNHLRNQDYIKNPQKQAKLEEKLKLNEIEVQPPTNDIERQKQIKLCHYLKKKEKKKAARKGIVTASWILAAIGMSFIAAAAFPGPHSVPCIIIGIVLTAIAAIVRLCDSTLAKKAKESITHKSKEKSMRDKLLDLYFNNHIFHDYTTENQLDFILKYSKSKEELFKKLEIPISDWNLKDEDIKKSLGSNINESEHIGVINEIFQKAKHTAMQYELVYMQRGKGCNEYSFNKRLNLFAENGFVLTLRTIDNETEMKKVNFGEAPQLIRVGKAEPYAYYFHGKHRFGKWKTVKINNPLEFEDLFTKQTLRSPIQKEISPIRNPDLFKQLSQESLHRQDKKFFKQFLKETETSTMNAISLDSALNPKHQFESWRDLSKIYNASAEFRATVSTKDQGNFSI